MNIETDTNRPTLREGTNKAENESSGSGYESTENKITGYLLTKHPPIAKKN